MPTALLQLETVLQAAKRIPSVRSKSRHVDVNVVRRWIHSGKLTRHYYAGQVMVDRAEVNALLASRERGAQAVDESWHRLMVRRAIDGILNTKD